MLTRVLRRLGAPTLIAGLLVGLGGTPAVAAPDSGAATPQKYCAVLVTPAKAAAAEAPALVCSDASEAAAKAALPAAAASVRLMTAYSDANFQGSSLNFYGDYGYCDEDGYSYSLYLYDDWALKISSIRGYQTCNSVVGLSLKSPRKAFAHNLSWSFGGTIFNDNMNNVRVFCNRNC